MIELSTLDPKMPSETHFSEDLYKDKVLGSPSSKRKQLASTSFEETSDKKFPLKKRLKEKAFVERNTSDDKLSLFDTEQPAKEKSLSDDEHTRYNPMETERKAIVIEYPLLGSSINMRHRMSISSWDEVYNSMIGHESASSSCDDNNELRRDDKKEEKENQPPENINANAFDANEPVNSGSDGSNATSPQESDELIDIEETDSVQANPLTPQLNVADFLPEKPPSEMSTKKQRLLKGQPKKTVIVRISRDDHPLSPLVKKRISNGEAAHEDFKRQKRQKAPKKKQSKKKKDTEGSSQLCNILEIIWKRMRDHPDAYPFLAPVQAKHAPDYYTIISRPMDLRTIHEHLVHYKSHLEFLRDVKLMVQNCHTYNKGRNPALPPMADALYKVCKSGIREMRQQIGALEKEEEEKQRLTPLPTTFIEDPVMDPLTSSPLSAPDEENAFVDIDDSCT